MEISKPKSENVVVNDHNDQEVNNAKNIEIKNWKDYNDMTT